MTSRGEHSDAARGTSGVTPRRNGTGALVVLFGRAVAFAREQPRKVLAWVLGLHFLVWTILPILLCPNLQLDLVEDLALGKEWQLGYWKHPPLPWWLADLVYRLTGDERAVYVLGPLAAVICFYGVWLLAREVVGEFESLLAVLILEGIHYYNFSVVKFAHDQMQLPFWAFTALYFYRALARGRTGDWVLAGIMLAGAFWSKYAAFSLAATLGLFLLFDPVARRAWRTPGPYLMGLAFAIVIAPNAWWVVEHGFMPFRYVDVRAPSPQHWYDYLVHPLQWIGGQLLFLLPAVELIVLLYGRDIERQSAADEKVAFARRLVTVLALGPFVVTTVTAIALGRLPVAMWGYPLWSFAPLAVLMWVGPVTDPRRLRWFAAGFIAVFAGFPLTYAIVEPLEPIVRDRAKATQFPGRMLAELITREWRQRTGQPLVYVGGAEVGSGPGEFAANNVAVYSPDHPHVIVHGNMAYSPWIDPTDFEHRGGVLVWAATDSALPANVRAAYPRAELQPPLVLPRQTIYPRSPAIIHYAVLPPQP
jgi:Dolichyl-phosphate-mannose-protein mannosyltransferase